MDVHPDAAGVARVGLEVSDPDTLEAVDVDVDAVILDAAGDELVVTVEPLPDRGRGRYALRFIPPAPGEYRLEVAVSGAIVSAGADVITVS